MIPDLRRAPDELVAAGTLHAIDAHIGAADANRVLRCPGDGDFAVLRKQTAERLRLQPLGVA